VFDTLDWLEERLSTQRYLVGNRLTEADWRLFTTLVRFDAVYYSHFKCNRQQLRDFPNLQGYLKDLYQVPGVAETVNLDQIKRHYYRSQRTINPTQIVPLGPRVELEDGHDRGRLGPDFPEAAFTAGGLGGAVHGKADQARHGVAVGEGGSFSRLARALWACSRAPSSE